MTTTQQGAIVIGVDSSPGTTSALAYGLELAERRHARVRLPHALEPSLYDCMISGANDADGGVVRSWRAWVV